LDITPRGHQSALARRRDERCEPLIPERVGNRNISADEGDEAVTLLKPAKLAFSAE
jgi:hypothetical protein